MIADDAIAVLSFNPPRRIASRALGGLRRLGACWWWTLQVHVAATHGIPRSALEPPPDPRLAVFARPPPTLPRRRGDP